MGIGDYVDKAKKALEGHEDKAADALDKAADAIKSRTSDSNDAKVDQVVDKAKEFLEKEKHGTGEGGAPARHTERPDPPAL